MSDLRKPSRYRVLVLTSLATSLLAATGAGAADPPRITHPRSAQTSSAGEYWTPERMRAAQPLPLPEAPPDSAPAATETGPAIPLEPGSASPGAPPSVEVLPVPAAELPEAEPQDADDDAAGSDASELDTPSSSGTSGCFFSSSRLNPRTIDVKYPYSAVGKLFFTKPGIGDFVCSGAVLRQRVVLTAGHCVHAGNGLQSGFFSNFLFCPAYRGAPSARFGCWSWAFLTTTTDWFSGGGTVPNAADYAMIEMVDRSFGGTSTRIGAVTGYFGYATSVLSANHVHMLGYPVEFSSGLRMHQVAAGRCYAGGSNTERYGSDMRGGSSGGPWVQDFGRPATGQTVSNPAGPNLIVGVMSYTNNSQDPKYSGSSIPDARFDALLSTICPHKSGNCS